jgi:16S rRNA (guanine966-N2)-methyltransferase
MRITSGKYKGRVLRAPKGIRPTQEKVRKALFDILGGVEGLSFLELYAGSGAVGLEAFSRGARSVVMVEHNRDCQMDIGKNIEVLGARGCQLIPVEAQKAVEALARKGARFDIVFLDPPYYQELSKKTLQMLGAYDILAPDGLLTIQHFKKDELPHICGEFILVKEAKYGDTVLSFYRKKGS